MNKHLYKPINHLFEIKIQQHLLNTASNIKYFDMLVDDNLNWSSHILELSLHLAKSVAILHRFKNCINAEMLRLLYYGLVYTLVQYTGCPKSNRTKILIKIRYQNQQTS